MRRLTRLHTSGSEAVLKGDSEGWRIHLNIRETGRIPSTTVGLYAPTLDEAKQLAEVSSERRPYLRWAVRELA